MACVADAAIDRWRERKKLEIYVATVPASSEQHLRVKPEDVDGVAPLVVATNTKQRLEGLVSA